LIAVAIKGLGTRKLRAFLTAFAIILGVAMVSGAYVLSDTVSRSFDNLFTGNYQGTTAVISGRDLGLSSRGVTAAKPTVDATLIDKVRALPGVKAAAGSTSDTATVLGRNGKALGTLGAPVSLFGYDFSEPRFVPLKLTAGSFPSGTGELAVDQATASHQGFHVGGPIEVVTHGPGRRFTISGIVRYNSGSSIGGAVFVVADLTSAQQLYGKQGKVDTISVAARNGVSTATVIRQINQILPQSAVVRTAAQQTAQTQKDQGTTTLTSLLRTFLLVFGGISLFVGAFVIFNTFSITVAQRTRELATLRTLGATPRQVLVSVLLEALVLGAIASVVGLFVGLAVAQLLQSLLSSLGIDLPATSTVFAFHTVIISMAVGLIVTALAGLSPALRATRVAPILAVREGAALPGRRVGRVRQWVATVAAVVGAVMVLAALITSPATSSKILLTALGSVLLVVAFALVLSRLVSWVAWAVGWPAGRFGGTPGELARHNARRNPGRVAVTAAALLVGLALVTFVSVFLIDLRDGLKNTVVKQINADYVVSSGGRDPFQTAAADAVTKASGVTDATSVRSDLGKVVGSTSSKTVTGVDPATIGKMFNFVWVKGSDSVLATLGSSGAIVSNTFANENHLSVGQQFKLLTPSASQITLKVAAIDKPPKLQALLGDVTVSLNTYDRNFDKTKTQFTLLKVSGGPSPATEALLKRVLSSYPDAKLETRTGYASSQTSVLSTLLNLIFLLLALAIVVSLLGIVNTLALSVFERTRELGMLRAVGMVRRQIRWMILHESVIVALIGGVLGIVVGLVLGALISAAFSAYGVGVSIPVLYLVAFILVALVAGLLASILPARRATRLDVLSALQYE
jgi:putative ABC transport system permease protein